MRTGANGALESLCIQTFHVHDFRTFAQVAAHMRDAEFRMELHAPYLRRVAHRLAIVERGACQDDGRRRRHQYTLQMRRLGTEYRWQ